MEISDVRAMILVIHPPDVREKSVLKKIFFWKIVDLHCCVSFSHTAKCK